MATDIMNNSTSNRRHAPRIYEQVDLFYQKIVSPADYSKPSQHQDDVTSFKQDKEGHLPKSSSQENETLNVNISASGISYTCQEELNAGEHILLRILLLSSMTVITVSCEVVYCKPSNPFENDRYPFLIGGRFINIRAEDTTLLERHIHRKKVQRYPFQALLALLMITTIVSPDLILELVIGLVEFVAEFTAESLYILFEVVSMYLDHAVEAIFHTKIQGTQLISFYFMWAVAGVVSFLTFKKVVSFCKTLFYKWKIFYCRKKASLNYYWYEKTVMHKVSFITASIAVCLTYILFFI